MKIEKFFLGDKEVTDEEGERLAVKYVTSHMELEALFGGITIDTPEGKLRAEVSLS